MHINIVYFSHPGSSISFCKCMYTIYYITKICKSKKLLHVSIRCNNLEWELLAPLIFFPLIMIIIALQGVLITYLFKNG